MRTKKYFYNSLTSVLLYIVTLGCGLIIPRLIIRTYGSATNGLISSIGQFLGYIAIAQAGMGAVSRAALYKPLSEKNTEAISSIVASTESFFRKISIAFLLYLLALVVVYPLFINKDFDWLFTASLILVISFSIFSEYFFGMAYALLLQADQSLYITNILQTVLYALNFVVVYTLIKQGFSIQIVKVASAAVFCVRPVFIRYYVRKKYRILPADKVPKTELKQKGAAFGQHMAYYLYFNTDIALLTLFSTLSEVSVYSVYNSIAVILQSVITQITAGIEPVYGDMIAKGEYENIAATLRKFELIMAILVSVIMTTAVIMFVPFVKLYMSGVSDANYIRYSLAAAMVCTQLVYCIRLPYAWIVTAAGHFAQTQVAAYAEAAMNIVLSLVLMHFMGTVGLVIATAAATLMRTIYFANYVSTKILKRSLLLFFKRCLVTAGTIAVILLMNNSLLPEMRADSYYAWCVRAVLVFCGSTVITVIINFLLYRKDMMSLIKFLNHKIKQTADRVKHRKEENKVHDTV